jgi:hypothetical protein
MVSNKPIDPRTMKTGLVVATSLFAFNFGMTVCQTVDKPNLSNWQLVALASSAATLVLFLFTTLYSIWRPHAASGES